MPREQELEERLRGVQAQHVAALRELEQLRPLVHGQQTAEHWHTQAVAKQHQLEAEREAYDTIIRRAREVIGAGDSEALADAAVRVRREERARGLGEAAAHCQSRAGSFAATQARMAVELCADELALLAEKVRAQGGR